MKRENLAVGGALLAAVGASLCCIGPLLFVALGVSAFSAATIFESARPYLLGAATLALAFGFYRAYFRRETCAPDEACAAKPVNRAGRRGLWIASVAVLAFALAPYYAGHISAALIRRQPPVMTPALMPAVGNDKAQSSLDSVVVQIEGMDCASCEMPIKAALEKTPGVRAADVSYERGNAQVGYDPQQTDANQIKRAIATTGYKAR